MQPPGIEPGSPDWQSGILTTRQRLRIYVNRNLTFFKIFQTGDMNAFLKSSNK